MSIPQGNSAVSQAVDKIYLLINSQMILEQKQAKLEANGQGDGTAAFRMSEIGETLEKLLTLAKKKGYIGPECTIETLKDQVRQRRQDDDQKEDEDQLNAMKNDLAEQTAASEA